MKRQYELKGSPIHCSLEVIFSIVRENTHLPTGDVGFSLSLPEIKKNVTLMSLMLAILTIFNLLSSLNVPKDYCMLTIKTRNNFRWDVH